MNLNSLKIGDLIVTEKGPFSAHYMVYAGVHDGVKLVAENQNGKGVQYISMAKALNGKIIKRFEKFGGSEIQRRLVIRKINSMVGRSYDLIVFNCEHFAKWISNGKIESGQVRKGANMAIGGGIGLLLSKNSTVQKVGAGLIIIGLFVRFIQWLNKD